MRPLHEVPTRRDVKPPRRSRDGGQTLVIAGLTLIVLVGVMGLALDVGRLYLTSQSLTEKTDAASLAGAQNLSKSDATSCYAAQVPGGSVASGTAGVAPCDGINVGNANTSRYAINGDCVEVTTPYSDTYTQNHLYSSTSVIKVRAYTNYKFMIGSLFGFGTKHVYANSISLQKGGGTALQTLAPSGSKSLHVNSGANVTVTGNVQVNSNGPNALWADGNMSATAMKVVGGYKLNGGTLTPTPQTGQPSAPDPFASLPIPSPPSPSYGGVTLSSGTMTINPGTYTDDIIVTGGTLIMNPGIYYMDNADFISSGTGVIQGNGVIIYLNQGANLTLGGGAVNLTAPTSGTYAGVLAFGDRTDNQTISLSGNTLSGTLSGALYTAAGYITVNPSGSGTISNAQLVANTIDLYGNLTIQGASSGGGSRKAMLIE